MYKMAKYTKDVRIFPEYDDKEKHNVFVLNRIKRNFEDEERTGPEVCSNHFKK